MIVKGLLNKNCVNFSKFLNLYTHRPRKSPYEGHALDKANRNNGCRIYVEDITGEKLSSINLVNMKLVYRLFIHPGGGEGMG